MECLFLYDIVPHVTTSSNFNPHQSESGLTLPFFLSSIIVLLQWIKGSLHSDLSTWMPPSLSSINLLNRHQTSFGIIGLILSCVRSYLTDLKQFVKTGRSCSDKTACRTGLPQRSVLRVHTLPLYISPIASVAKQHWILMLTLFIST